MNTIIDDSWKTQSEGISWQIGDKLSGMNFSSPFTVGPTKQESYKVIGELEGIYLLLDSRGFTYYVKPELVGCFYPHYKAMIGDMRIAKV